ncbi:MAG: ParA family protein [Deltaproteobacteria bacterium]
MALRRHALSDCARDGIGRVSGSMEAAMVKPVIMAVANQKGGVGKTTTAVNLAAALAARGVRTLLVDLDIQGSASAFLGMSPGEDDFDVARALLEEKPMDAAIRETRIPNLSIAPAGERMSLVDLHLASVYGRERVFERALQSPMVKNFDLVIVDTAPYLGLLTVNALVAADKLLVPVSCEYLPMLGLKLLGETLERLRDRAGARAEILGYVLSLYDRRERITLEVEGLLRQRFGEAVLESVVRVNTQHKSAPSHRRTIFEHEPEGGRGREDFEALAVEVSRRLGLAMPVAATRTRKTRVRTPANAKNATATSRAAG